MRWVVWRVIAYTIKPFIQAVNILDSTYYCLDYSDDMLTFCVRAILHISYSLFYDECPTCSVATTMFVTDAEP